MNGPDARRLGLAVVAALAAIASCTAPPTDSSSADVTSEVAPLENEDFEGKIDKAVLRRVDATLDDAAFERKWTASHESPVMFMRAYPGAYHQDLARVARRRIPGDEGLCFGDAHPDNFGLLSLEGKTRFLYNDLDDSGYCLVAIDAARYFAVLHVMLDDKDLEGRVLEQYVDTLKDGSRAKTLDGELVPALDAMHADRLAELVEGDSLVLEDGVERSPQADRTTLEKTLAAEPRLTTATILDSVSVARDAGGSGGLRRYRLLVSRPSGRTVLELKEAGTPGTDLGRHDETLAANVRLERLKPALWGTRAADDYFYVTVDGSRFLVRDRLAKKSIDLTKLDKKDLEEVLVAEASHLALLHSDGLRAIGKDDLRTWVGGTSHTLAKRWKGAMAPD